MARFLDLDEQEQVAQIKNFFKDNAKYFIALLLVIVLVYAGWSYYQHKQQKLAVDSAATYYELIQAIDNSNKPQIEQFSQQLKQEYAKSAVTQEAVLLTAKYYFDQRQLNQAKQNLEWVVKQNFNSVYQGAAQFRLATIAFDEGKLDEALNWLNESTIGDTAVVNDLRGDILKAQGKTEQAIEQYKKVYVDEQSGLRAVALLKLSKLGQDINNL